MSDTQDFVRASLNGDAVNASASFDSLMRNRIATSVDSLRQTTAANLVATSGADDEENSSES